MKIQKIMNFINDSSIEESKFATKNGVKFEPKVQNQVFVIILIHFFSYRIYNSKCRE